MKLTPELLAQASSALNPIKQRQLDLRGYKIPAIENLGVTRDQHDAIDLTDNSIVALGNLPLLKRLHALLLANNRIASISPSLHLSVPNLATLVLTNNNVCELGDLEPLKELRGLKYVSLMGNPVREKKMVSRVACVETCWAESFGFPENTGQGTTDGENTVSDGRESTHCPGNHDIDDCFDALVKDCSDHG